MADNEERDDVPDLPGLIFKDVTLAKDADTCIGKYIVGFAKNGKKVVKLLSFDAKESKVTYEVITGEAAQVGKRFKALVEPQMPFYAYAEDALPYALAD